MAQATVLVVEDDRTLQEALTDTLQMAGYRTLVASNGEEAMVHLGRVSPDLVVSDINMPGMDGHDLLSNIRQTWANLPVLLMTAYGSISSAVQAMRQGATDYLTKPFSPEHLVAVVNRYVGDKSDSTGDPVVADPRSTELLKIAQRVAAADATVMVTGPSGTGKEVLARYVHKASPRSDKPFVAINCAAIPDNMLEATLFGYEKGAFTGAHQACPGKFEQAQGGTLFLDEIGEMDLNLQAKLLRVLQEKEVERLGGRKTISLDVRVVAATNRDLKEQVAEGRFREDLFYRLNVFPLTWLPLRDRPGDILPLADHLLARHARSQGRPVPKLSQDAVTKLAAYHWPGNVRELDNVIQRALILQDGEAILPGDLHLEGEVATPAASVAAQPEAPAAPAGFNDSLGSDVRNHEFRLILDALRQFNGSRKHVAEKLGVSPRTLRYKLARMREQGIEVPHSVYAG